jgi:hypothetical protein
MKRQRENRIGESETDVNNDELGPRKKIELLDRGEAMTSEFRSDHDEDGVLSVIFAKIPFDIETWPRSRTNLCRFCQSIQL